MEGRLALAVASIENQQLNSIRRAAKAYDVPRTTLQRRLKNKLPISKFNASKRKISLLEEQTLVQWALDRDQRGFPPNISDLTEMANTLLAARESNPPAQPVGKNWATRFIKSQPLLKTQWSRSFSSQRASCEEVTTITDWFKLVQQTRLEYGIGDDDCYNFDETGFAMGLTATSTVITSVDRNGRAPKIQPGNREWTTVIEGINAIGWAIPPFIIMAAKLHQASWYEDLPNDWMIAVSDNGWTNHELGLSWLEHFNNHTKNRTIGRYRLLILDGHTSHLSLPFDQYCKDHQIITLCMPAHTSHLLQPLDVSCFSPLKRYYSQEIQRLTRQGIHHISKSDFLQAYITIRSQAISESNIISGFKATGLVPFNPNQVLSSLTITHTPSLPTTPITETEPWTAETPHSLPQLQQQAQLVQQLLQRKSQSPTNLAIKQLVKGCQMAMQSAIILTKENSELRITNQRRQHKQQQRRRFIANRGVLQAQQAQILIEDQCNSEIGANSVVESTNHQRAPPTCSNCYEQGHRRTHCPLPLQFN